MAADALAPASVVGAIARVEKVRGPAARGVCVVSRHGVHGLFGVLPVGEVPFDADAVAACADRVDSIGDTLLASRERNAVDPEWREGVVGKTRCGECQGALLVVATSDRPLALPCSIEGQAGGREPEVCSHEEFIANLIKDLPLNAVLAEEVQGCGMRVRAVSSEERVCASRIRRICRRCDCRTNRKWYWVSEKSLQGWTGLRTSQSSILVVQVSTGVDSGLLDYAGC